MNGLWLLRNGETIETSDMISHSEALRNENLETYLKEVSNYIDWSEYEKMLCLNSDIAYVAFKIGFIRVTKWNNDFNVEFLLKPNKYQIEKLLEFIKGFNSITFCKFMGEDTYVFYDEKSLMDYLY